MIAQIDHNIVRSLFHVKINVQAPQPAPKQVTRTNEDTISQSITDGNKTSEDKIKIGRNDPCPCGSGKKYKKCHGKAD